MVSDFSVINASLRWTSGPRVTKPLEHLLTCGAELADSEEGGLKKTKRGDGNKSKVKEEETVGARRKKENLERRRSG